MGPSDLLIVDPSLTNNLAAVVLLFRQFKYACSTRVFHQVLLDERDLETFRLLFFTDETMRDVTVRRFLSHIFASGASSCVTPFTTRHLAERVKSQYPEFVYSTIRKQHYVDDARSRGDTVNKVVDLKLSLSVAMAQGGFALSKGKVDHPALLPQEVGQLAPCVDDKLEKILGVWWHPREDDSRF